MDCHEAKPLAMTLERKLSSRGVKRRGDPVVRRNIYKDMYKNFLKDTADPFDSDSSYGTKANAALVKILKYANEDQMKEFAKKMKEFGLIDNFSGSMFYLKRALNNVTVSNDEFGY